MFPPHPQQSLDKFESIVGEELGLERRSTPEDLRAHLTQLRQGDKVLTNSLAQLRARWVELGKISLFSQLNYIIH